MKWFKIVGPDGQTYVFQGMDINSAGEEARRSFAANFGETDMAGWQPGGLDEISADEAQRYIAATGKVLVTSGSPGYSGGTPPGTGSVPPGTTQPPPPVTQPPATGTNPLLPGEVSDFGESEFPEQAFLQALRQRGQDPYGAFGSAQRSQYSPYETSYRLGRGFGTIGPQLTVGGPFTAFVKNTPFSQLGNNAQAILNTLTNYSGQADTPAVQGGAFSTEDINMYLNPDLTQGDNDQMRDLYELANIARRQKYGGFFARSFQPSYGRIVGDYQSRYLNETPESAVGQTGGFLAELRRRLGV